jgi:hypothetical protein
MIANIRFFIDNIKRICKELEPLPCPPRKGRERKERK